MYFYPVISDKGVFMRPTKPINQIDIAKRLGVSHVSVSNALTGKKGVSPALREKILQTAAQMGYQADGGIEAQTAGLYFYGDSKPVIPVLDDGFYGAQMAVRYLCRQGHQTIYFVRPNPDIERTSTEELHWQDRLLGYRCARYLQTVDGDEAVAQAEPFDLGTPELVLSEDEVSGRLSAWKETGRLMFFCADETIAGAVASALEKEHPDLPEDYFRIGYIR